MITVRRSDIGTYVLVHEPTQVMMVGEDLQATYAQLEEHLREHPGPPGVATSPPSPAAPSRRVWLVGLGVLALLPFLWLSVLHYTLGRMIDELRTPAASSPTATKEVEALQTQLHALEQTVDRLQTEVGETRIGEPLDARRRGPARRPVEVTLSPKGMPEDVDDEPDEDDADQDESEQSPDAADQP